MLNARAAGLTLELRTSGTSGRPRSVLRTPESWFDSFRAVAEMTGLTTRSWVWVPGPLTGTMNLFAAVLARWAGAHVVERPTGVTHAHLTPLALARALDAGVPLAGVRATVAGDRLGRGLHDRATDAGVEVSHYYGASELSFVAWGCHADDLRPFPGVEVEVREGVVWARSPYLCTGYAGTPGPMRRDGSGFATVGDRGWLADGVLTVHGRDPGTVVTGGATVRLADVEELLRLVARGDVAVLAVPHPQLGEVVVAVLTDAADHRAACATARRHLAPAQRPRRWFHFPSLPAGEAGKVDRAALGALLDDPAARRLVGRT